MTPLYLILGGALGTLARYYGATRVGEWAHSNAIGVFAVNVVGAFVIGLFLTLSEDRGGFSREARLLVATGFLGAFTTFSAITWDTLQFAEARDFPSAALNLFGTFVVGMAAVWLGAQAARIA
jgi:CrcB protein